MNTMNYTNIRIELENNNAIIFMSRVSKLNALNTATLTELHHAMVTLNENKNVIGIIITGDGEKAFVAGADITEIAQLSINEAKDAALFGQNVFFAIENATKPVIASVNGFALGGGCELAMACHIRIAAENAQFGQPEVNLGIIPGYGATQRLPKLVGPAKALELMLSAEIINAQKALEIGLVSYVTTPEDLLSFSKSILNKITSKSAFTTERVIKAMNGLYDKQVNGFDHEASLFAECTTSDDFKEGTTAFLEKRKPNFTNK